MVSVPVQYINNRIWGVWSDTSACCTNSNITSSTTTWSYWNGHNNLTGTASISANTTSPTTSAIVWGIWSSQEQVIIIATNNVVFENCQWNTWVDEEFQNEQKRAAKVQQRINQEWPEHVKKTSEEEAEEKAKMLLLDLIGEEQIKVYNKTGRIFVKGNKYDYIVQKDGDLRRIEKDKIQDLCIHLVNKYCMPKTDNVIALKLAIEGDEENVIRLANKKYCVALPEKLPEAACM